METHDGDRAGFERPGGEEAAEALREAEAIRDDVSRVGLAVPWWYFPLLALGMAGIALAQLLPTFATIGVTIVLAMVIGGAAGAVMHGGRHVPRVRMRQVLPLMLPLLVLVIAAIVLDQRYGRSWVWYVVAVASVVFILGIGLLAHRAAKEAQR